MNKFARAKLNFPLAMVLKSNLNLPVSFSPVSYDVTDVTIREKKIDFSLGKKFFRNVDAIKLGIDIKEE